MRKQDDEKERTADAVLAGITAHLFFEIEWMGYGGYAALIVSSASEIIRMLKEKKQKK